MNFKHAMIIAQSHSLAVGPGRRLGGRLGVLCRWACVSGASTIRRRSPHAQLVILQWGDASEEAIVQSMKEQFEAQHPDIKVLRIQASDFDSKLKTMMAAGTPPDLFYLSYEHVPEFVRMHLLANLDPYIAAEPDGKQWIDGFYPVPFDAFRYDGKQGRRGARGQFTEFPRTSPRW